jgi:hypothetical protein
MSHGIAIAFLAGLSLLFGSYGLRALALAYRTIALDAWSERALPGAGGIFVAALFALMLRQVLG